MVLVVGTSDPEMGPPENSAMDLLLEAALVHQILKFAPNKLMHVHVSDGSHLYVDILQYLGQSSSKGVP